MKKSIALFTIILLLFPIVIYAQDQTFRDPGYVIGDKVENFTMMSVDGKPYTLYTEIEKEGSEGVLLMWVSWNCPISNNCNDRMIAVARFCEENNIKFLGINPNSIFYDGPNEVVHAAAVEAGFEFPVLRDWNAVYTDKFRSRATPTAMLIDTEKVLRYRGRIDNAHGWLATERFPSRRPNTEPTEHTLMIALNEFLAGEELTSTDMRSIGCTIKRLSQYDQNHDEYKKWHSKGGNSAKRLLLVIR